MYCTNLPSHPLDVFHPVNCSPNLRMLLLDTLGEELVATVLSWLPGHDLRRARQACRLLDRASRCNMQDRGTALKLNAECTGGQHGFPNFSRFPRLRRLQLLGFGPAQAELLNDFGLPNDPQKQSALQNLANVGEVDLTRSILDAPAMAAVLRVTPGATHLFLGRMPGGMQNTAQVRGAQGRAHSWAACWREGACVPLRIRVCGRARECEAWASLCFRVYVCLRMCMHVESRVHASKHLLFLWSHQGSLLTFTL